MSKISYKNTIVQELAGSWNQAQGIRLLVKREDNNHPAISGNKWWKLKHNLEQAHAEHHDTLLTFGGAFSNHIYATAAAAKELGLKSIGIIRGEEVRPLNPTLSFAEQCGMRLQFISRELYRFKNAESFLEDLHNTLGRFYLLPEGGTNSLAIQGCAEFAQLVEQETAFDYCCLAAGTGGTVYGLAKGFSKDKKIIAFPVLKDGGTIERMVREVNTHHRVFFQSDYHFGGYAKTSSELNEFIDRMWKTYGLPLDPVYTGKMMYGVMDLISKNYFPTGSKVLVIHTGGLQGSSKRFDSFSS